MRLRNSVAILFMGLQFGAGAHLLALPDDRLQAIEITAEHALRDEKAGFTVYSGQVVLAQGSLYIEADRVTVYHDREAADRIIAIGSPARLRQQPAIDKGVVTASARRIVYEKSRERVLLREDASIEQDGAVVSGESIDYLMAEQRVRADASASDDNARVQVIIPAAVIEAETADDEDPGDQAQDEEAAEESPAPAVKPKGSENPAVGELTGSDVTAADKTDGPTRSN